MRSYVISLILCTLFLVSCKKENIDPVESFQTKVSGFKKHWSLDKFLRNGKRETIGSIDGIEVDKNIVPLTKDNGTSEFYFQKNKKGLDIKE